MYNGVIFDLDGTLLDTLEDLASAGNYALKTMGFQPHETERYKGFVGNGIPKLIERFMPSGSSSDTLKKAHGIFSEYYEAHKCDKTVPYGGIIPLLDKIVAKGIKTAVVTNKAHGFAVEIIRHFFGERFDCVIGQQDGVPKKPDPCSVLKIQKRWQMEKSLILYVGDSGVDMETARNGGFDGCGVLWGFREKEELVGSGAKYIAENVQRLQDIIFG